MQMERRVQLLFELSAPALLPYFVYHFGTFSLHTIRYFPGNNSGFYSTVLPQVLYLIVVAGMCSERVNLRLTSLAAVPFFFVLFHRVTVAFKYATLSPGEFTRMRRGADVDHSGNKYTLDAADALKAIPLANAHQLIYYFPYTRETAFFDVLASASKLQVDLSQLVFTFSSEGDDRHAVQQEQRWRHLLRSIYTDDDIEKHVIVKNEERGRYSVNVLSVAAAISFTQSNAAEKTIPSRLPLPCALFFSLIPFFQHKQLLEHNTAVENVFVAALTLFTINFSFSIFVFMRLSLVDQMRRYLIARLLGDMVRDAELPQYPNLRLQQHTSVYGKYNPNSHSFQAMQRTRKGLDTDTRFRSRLRGQSVETSLPRENDNTHENIVAPFTVNPLFSEGQSARQRTDAKRVSMSVDVFQSSSLDDTSAALPPVLDSTSNHNPFAWKLMRRMFQTHSERIKLRFDCIIALTVILEVGMQIYLVRTVLGREISSADAEEFLRSSSNHQVFVALFFFSLLILSYIFLGILVNRYMEIHRSYVNDMRLQEKSEDLFDDLAEGRDAAVPRKRPPSSMSFRLRMAARKLNFIRSIKIDDCLYPNKIVGIKCTGTLAISFISALGVVLTAVYQLLSSCC